MIFLIMRKGYGLIFIAFVVIFVFQIVILDESSASFHPEQDVPGSYHYQGNYGAAPKNTNYQIGTSIRANSIRDESDPQVTPYQCPYGPSGINYASNNNNNYNYGPVASPESGYYDPGKCSYGPMPYYDPNLGASYVDPNVGYYYPNGRYSDPNWGYYYDSYAVSSPYNDPSGVGSDPNRGCYDPYAVSSPYNDPDSSDPVDDPGITTPAGAGGMANLLSGFDPSGIIMNAMPGIIGRMLGGLSAPTAPINPLTAATNPVSTASTASSPVGASGIDITTLPTEGIDAAIGPPTSDTEINTGTLPHPSGTDSLTDGSSHKDFPYSQHPSKMDSLWKAANHFNSKTKNTGKKEPMLILTPIELKRSELDKTEYSPQLSDEEMAKLYNNLARKKKMSVLLLTDENDKSPHESMDETHTPLVLEDNGDDKNFIDKIGDHYQYIPSLEDLSDKSISGINLQPSAKRKSNTIHSAQVRKDNEGEKIADYYEIILNEMNLSGKPAPRVELNSSTKEKPSINHSTRVRKDNEDFMKELNDFYEIIPVEMDSSEKPTTGIEPHARKEENQNLNIGVSNLKKDSNNKLVTPSYNSNEYSSSVRSDSEIIKSNSRSEKNELIPVFLITDDDDDDRSLHHIMMNMNHSKHIRRDSRNMIGKMSDFYDFIPVEIDSFGKTTTGIKPHLSEEENSSHNNSERVRKHNKDIIKAMGDFYDFIPFEMDSFIQTAPGIETHSLEEEKTSHNNSERVRKHNKDIIKTMSDFYDFIPVEMDSFNQTASGIEPHLSKEGKSSYNNSERVRKHNKDIIKAMSEFYDFIPVEMDSFEETAPGIEPHLPEEEKSSNNSERVRKHNKDIIKAMSEFYDFIPIEMDLYEETAPGIKPHSSEEEKSSHNNSERVRKDDKGIIRKMSPFYEFIPTEIEPHSKTDENTIIDATNLNKIMNIQNGKGIIDSIEKDEFTLTPRFYRMVPKIGPFMESGIDSRFMHSSIKNYIFEDLKSKVKSNFNLNDKLLVVADGLKHKEYLLAKKRDYITGEKGLCKACEQNPNKYIFRLTCYDPHSHKSNTEDKSFILHFDCLKKISPLITNILKNVEKHHFCSSDCDSSDTYPCKSHEQHNNYDATGGSFGRESYNAYPGSSSGGGSTNHYNNFNSKLTTKENSVPIPITIGNREGYTVNDQNFKSSTESTHTKLSSHIHEETSSEDWKINNSDQYEKSISVDNVSHDYATMDSHYLPSSLPIDLNRPYEIPRSTTGHSTPKLDFNIVNSLPTPHPTFYSEKYQSRPDASSKSGEYGIDSYYPHKSISIDSSNPLSSPCDVTEATKCYSCPKIDSNTFSSPPKPHPTFYPKTDQSRSDVFLTSPLNEIKPYSFNKNSPIDSSYSINTAAEIPVVTPIHSTSENGFNICHSSPNCEQTFRLEEEQSAVGASTKSPDHESGMDYMKNKLDGFGEEQTTLRATSRPPDHGSSVDYVKNKLDGFGELLHDYPKTPTIPNSRSSIMTISKNDHNKPKYLDKLKDYGLEQCKTIENATIVMEKRISDAIETLLNTSIQSSYKEKENSPCHLSTESEYTNQDDSSIIIKPGHPENINGGVCFNDSTLHQGPEIGKCHLKEHLSTKHTQQILKNQNSSKLLQGFECKKTIQSNLCSDNVGPCICKNDCSSCKSSPSPASKECETLANFLEKISLTLDKNSSKGNDSRECKKSSAGY